MEPRQSLNPIDANRQTIKIQKPKVLFRSSIQIRKRSSNKQDTYYENHPKQTSKIGAIQQIIKLPIMTKGSIVKQLKCFMSSSDWHDSFMLSKKLVQTTKKKLIKINIDRNYQFKEDEFAKLAKIILSKPNDSEIIVNTFNDCLKAYNYPVSINLMLMYMGVFIYSINGMYDISEQLCQKMYNQIIRSKIQEYLIIYLLLLVKIKGNLSQWSESIKLLKRLLAFAWLYKEKDLQSWCYFQFSRAFFFNKQVAESNLFKRKSEMSILQPETSIYREIIEKQLKDQLEEIRIYNYNLSLNKNIIVSRLHNIPQVEKSSQNKLPQLLKNAKSDAVRNHNLAQFSRAAHNDDLQSEKQSSPLKFAGNPHFLTHQSRIKNMNMYFRTKKSNINGKHSILYTMQNSCKSWLILRQMARYIFLEMRSFSQNN